MPQQELEKLQAIHRFLMLEIAKDAELQEITEITSEILDCPISMITIMEGENQIFLYKNGTDRKSNKRKDSFCQHLGATNPVLIVPDASLDARFINIESVTGPPNIRFYAGASLTTHDGHHLGSLCALDVKPHYLSDAQKHLLNVLANQVVKIIEFDYSIRLLKDLFISSRDAEIKLRSFFESSSACHLLIGPDKQLLVFNKNIGETMLKMFGVKLEIGARLNQLFKGAFLKKFTENYNRAIAGEVVKIKEKITYLNGESFWWYVTFEGCYFGDKGLIGISYNATDITEIKAQEEKITVQNRTLREIAFMQSHELRKPVANILGLAQLIKGNPDPTEELTQLQLATEQLDETINDINYKIDKLQIEHP